MYLFFLIIAFSLNSLANVLLKVSARYELSLANLGAALSSKAFFYLVLGLAAFAANVIFYYLALRHLPLSVAYPIMVGATVIITNLFAFLLFHESITLLQMIGYVCIVSGITLVFAFRPAL